MKRIVATMLAALSTLAFAQQAPMTDALHEWAGAESALKVHLSPRGTVTEFFNTTLKHYFRTGDPGEVAAIQNGSAGPGWTLTNDNFMAWTADFRPVNGLPVCRFYAAGPNSHFYTIDAAECDFVKKDPGWKYEGVAFYALAPTNGQCSAADYRPVYRLYNDRFAFNDSNHKFTTSATVYQSMQTASPPWKGEGIVMCAPLPTTMDQQRTEQLIGGTWVIPYRFGLTNYVDNLSFFDVIQGSDGSALAAGVNKFNRAAVGQWFPDLGAWLALATYSASGGYPYDAYKFVSVGTNTISGCYYFLLSSSSSTAGCNTPFNGTR